MLRTPDKCLEVRLQIMAEVPSIHDRIVAALARYNESYRHPSLRKLMVSDLYALFPDEAACAGAKCGWPEPWPNRDSPGVYLMLGADGVPLYVGKTWSLDARISSYFRYAIDGSRRCELRHPWKQIPMFVATIAVDDDKFFEAAGLEEYLIETLQPLDNARGIKS
jgi:hypothetical protein